MSLSFEANPHHAVPKPPPTYTPPPTEAPLTLTTANATGAIAGGIPHLVSARDVVLAMVIAVAGFLVSLALVVLASALRSRVAVVPARAGAGGGSRAPPLGAYTYKGARAALRRVYLALLSRLSRSGVRLPPGATASEAARAAASAGLMEPLQSREFSGLYNFYMYSRVEPGPGDVERVAEVAGVRDAVKGRG